MGFHPKPLKTVGLCPTTLQVRTAKKCGERKLILRSKILTYAPSRKDGGRRPFSQSENALTLMRQAKPDLRSKFPDQEGLWGIGAKPQGLYLDKFIFTSENLNDKKVIEVFRLK